MLGLPGTASCRCCGRARTDRRSTSRLRVDQIKAHILAGERSLDLPVGVVHPAVAADDAPKLGIRELLGESTTSFAGSIPEKAHNIQLAAQRLNGVVVPPRGTFSFNKEVGPTTLEAGFQWGFGLTTGSEGGVHTVPSVAGGICQVATTLFQPVFWSGYQIEERYWHLYWIPAYTSRGIVGLDATVDSDSGLDFKWINPTDDPVLIQASTDAEHVTFRLYGQKPPWTVQVDDPVVSDRVVADPTPEVQAEPSHALGPHAARRKCARRLFRPARPPRHADRWRPGPRAGAQEHLRAGAHRDAGRQRRRTG